MSLVVSDGYRWNPPIGSGLKSNITDLFKQIGTFVPQAKQKCREAVTDQYSKTACNILDRHSLNLSMGLFAEFFKTEQNAVSVVYEAASQKRSETVDKGYRCPEHDWGCSIYIYAVPKRKVLVRLAAEKEIYSDLLKSIPGMQSYYYDGRVDGGDQFTKSEWQERYLSWSRTKDDQLLTGAPVEIKITSVSGYDPTWMQIIQAQPSLDFRAHKLAKEIIQLEFIDNYCKSQGVKIEMDLIFEGLSKFQDFSKSEEYCNNVQNRVNEYCLSLKSEYSEEDFKETISMDKNRYSISR